MIDIATTIQDLQLSLTPHANSRSLSEHLIRVGQLLEFSNECPEVVAAGYFHSIYGREFTRFKIPVHYLDRQKIVSFIGADAEELCYLNCAMNNDSFWYTLNFDLEHYHVLHDRFTNNKIRVSRGMLIKILRINFANMIDHYEPKSSESFRWSDLSLYLQNYQFLSARQQKLFDDTFSLRQR